MLTNAVRIVTLWFLATKVDIGFLYGNLHRNGGILFSLIALSILMGCLYLLRMLEGAREQAIRGTMGESERPRSGDRQALKLGLLDLNTSFSLRT